MVEPALHSSARQDWGTPPGFMRWLRHNRNWVPDLDAAASPHNAKATMFFTQEDNGLDRPWFGNVWLNPPPSGVRCRYGWTNARKKSREKKSVQFTPWFPRGPIQNGFTRMFYPSHISSISSKAVSISASMKRFQGLMRRSLQC